MRWFALLGVSLLCAGCATKPVTCATVESKAGTTRDAFTFDQGTLTVELTGCSDQATRRVTCRQAHRSAYKCECTLTQRDGTYSVLTLRTETELTEAGARVFGRDECEWKNLVADSGVQ